MRLLRICVLCGIQFLAISVWAQQVSPQQNQPPAPTKDPQAIAQFQSAISALGGVSAVSSIHDATFVGSLQLAFSTGNQTATFTWKSSGADFHEEVQEGGVTTRVYVSGHGTPKDLRNGTLVQLPPYAAQANLRYEVPALVLWQELNNPKYTLTYLGTTTINGAVVVHVHACDEADWITNLITPQDWYFSPATGLPLEIDYQIPDDVDPHILQPGSIQYGAFRPVNGVQVPFHLILRAGDISWTAVVSAVQFNSGLAADVFDLSTGGAQ